MKYTDNQLLERVEFIGGTIPNIGETLIIGLQSIENKPNCFDDKFYVYDGPVFQMVTTGTTNAGKTALMGFEKYNAKGAAVWKTNQWCPKVFEKGYHNANREDGGMKALRQVKPIQYYRDNDKDNFAEEIGELYKGIINTNLHGVSYDEFSKIIKELINGWSAGCQVWNNMIDYKKLIDWIWKRPGLVDYALLKEF